MWRKKRRTIDRDFWDNRRIDDISPQYSILLKSCVQFSPTVSVTATTPIHTLIFFSYCMVIGNRHFQFYCTNTSVQTSVCDDGSLLFANQALIIWAGLLGRDSPLSTLSSGESVLEFRDLLLEFGRNSEASAKTAQATIEASCSCRRRQRADGDSPP